MIKKAFTMVEILITLGIIGVVAAITLSNLIKEYKAHTLKSQFFKASSVISQLASQLENDGLNFRGSSFTSYLKLQKKCRIDHHGTYCNNKTISYKLFNYRNNPSYFYFGYLNSTMAILSDGMVIYTDDCPDYEGWKGPLVGVDINGIDKGPNRLGYDFFLFENVAGKIYPLGHEKTNYGNINFSTNKTDYCSKSDFSSNSGLTCASKALSDSKYFNKLW